MVQEMIKELTKVNSNSQYHEFERPLDGHNILEITNNQEEYDKKKKKCCKQT